MLVQGETCLRLQVPLRNRRSLPVEHSGGSAGDVQDHLGSDLFEMITEPDLHPNDRRRCRQLVWNLTQGDAPRGEQPGKLRLDAVLQIIRQVEVRTDSQDQDCRGSSSPWWSG